jgi:hypothetical protein
MIEVVKTFPDRAWADEGDASCTRGVESVLEGGGVLQFPHLAFELSQQELRFLDPAFADGKAKNISLRGSAGVLRGAAGTPEDQAEIRAMLLRFRDQAQQLADRLFPHYRGALTLGNTSYRPVAVEGRPSSWRKDDTRLHVDAFPSNPMRGVRLLRVFTNLNPNGRPRNWRVGEPFEDFARRFVPAIPRPWPGSSALLRALRITKARRTAYDHYMLHLHDLGKADLGYQRSAPQQAVDFAPGTTWVVYSDQVLHAAMGGQFMMEQTFYLPPGQQQRPETAPLRVLERLTGRPLLI